MKKLRKQIDDLLSKSGCDENVLEEIKKENTVFPFSIEGRILAYLLSTQTITYDDYLKLQNEYTRRNKYIYTYDLTSKSFGDWGERRLLTLFPELKKATKKSMKKKMPKFDGEFDLYVDDIKIEVKANRAAEDKKKTSLASRAYLHSEARSKKFKYHFEQVKPLCCDVFVFIGVCRDEILYWVLSSDELVRTKKISSQHRNENTGEENGEVFEGQVFMTEEELRPFSVNEKDVLKTIRKKAKKNKKGIYLKEE